MNQIFVDVSFCTLWQKLAAVFFKMYDKADSLLIVVYY